MSCAGIGLEKLFTGSSSSSASLKTSFLAAATSSQPEGAAVGTCLGLGFPRFTTADFEAVPPDIEVIPTPGRDAAVVVVVGAAEALPKSNVAGYCGFVFDKLKSVLCGATAAGLVSSYTN